MPHPSPPFARRCVSGAFTLVEVVLALGIASFCLVALIGLFSVGIRTERESSERLDAAHIAQSLIAARRASASAAPMGFPLPALVAGQGAEGTVLLDENGDETPAGRRARFKLSYRIDAPAAGEVAPFTLYLKISWPAQAPAGQQAGSIEHTAYLSGRS
jgi:type II secretory pathway pseudopilin PulG